MPHLTVRRLVRGPVVALAIAATASAALVAPPVQAQSPESETSASKIAATSLSIRVVKARIKPGQHTRVTGHLAVAGDTSPAGRTVTLEAKPKGTTEFVPIADDVTAARGGVSVQVEPGVTTRYRWRFLGDEETRASHSGIATLRVRTPAHRPHRLATSLSIRKVFRASASGGVDIVRGRLRAGRVSLPHRPVILLSKVPGATDWTYEGTRLTRRLGTVKFRVDPPVTTAYRTVFLGSKRLRPARSGVVRVPHRPDVSIAVTPSSIIRGETVTITGVVTDSGAPLAGVKVVLWASKVGHPANTRRVIESGTTAEDGTVVFTDEPKRSKKYRLRVVGGEDNKVAWSAAARVIVTPTSV